MEPHAQAGGGRGGRKRAPSVARSVAVSLTRPCVWEGGGEGGQGDSLAGSHGRDWGLDSDLSSLLGTRRPQFRRPTAPPVGRLRPFPGSRSDAPAVSLWNIPPPSREFLGSQEHSCVPTSRAQQSRLCTSLNTRPRKVYSKESKKNWDPARIGLLSFSIAVPQETLDIPAAQFFYSRALQFI